MAGQSQVPVINPAAAGKSLSAIKKEKKKRVSKNVLGLPENAKIKPPIVNDDEESEIADLLQRYLPAAKLPVQKKKKDKKDELPETDLSLEQKEKRAEMCLGINELTREIQRSKVAAAVIASDIKPSLLTAHLNFKCSRNKIPYLYLSNLRKVTQESLGFPCIALGFKVNGKNFLDVVKKISETYQQFKKEETVVKVEEQPSQISEMKEETNQKSKRIKIEPEFNYIYRTSKKERIFIPENEEVKKLGTDFIALTHNDDDDDVEMEVVKTQIGISQNLSKKLKKKKKKFKLENMDVDDLGIGGIDESDEVKKEKVKKDWIIDKQPDSKKFKYVKPNVVRYQSNPNRKGKSKVKKKKNFQGKNKS